MTPLREEQLKKLRTTNLQERFCVCGHSEEKS
jgi:hypothetical protein